MAQLPLHLPIELFTFAEGAAVDLFVAGMRKITDDLSDGAAKEEAPRTFSLKFTIRPVGAGVAKGTVEMTGIKMAPTRGHSVGLQMDRSSGQMVLTEARQASVEMPDNVTRIKENRDE